MNDAHWRDDDLIDRLYGLRPADGHLEGCEECGRRWRELEERRGKTLAAPAVPEAFLASQRRAVFGRLRAPERTRAWPLAHGFAAAALLIVAVSINRPAPQAAPMIASSDAQFFSEVFSSISGVEPSAVAPVEGLFEVSR